MSIASYSIKNKSVIWMMIVLFVAGGIYAYFNLGRFEDPEFTIKEALVVTTYPGATPKEVEKEVTDTLETEIQQMPQLKRLESVSKAGYSDIKVVIKDKYTSKDLPQVWDELRRKVNDVQSQLPPGAKASVVNDDFGDVYGMLYALTGEGFTYQELEHYAKFFKRQLSLVPGVAKVQITGERKQTIFVDISRTRMAELGISLNDIYRILRAQNQVVRSGNVRVGDDYIRITPTGAFDSVNSISNILVRSKKTDKLIRLSDIGTIKRGYEEVPKEMIFFNGKPALAIGLSTVSGGNVVKVGAAVREKAVSLASQVPVGIESHPIYQQPKIVTQSINGFMVSLLQALAIVMVVLLIFMGLRSGIIISFILLLTVLGSLLVMWIFGISLERISLGALIIALGMLVDNAIVVTEGILVKSQQGISVLKASEDTVKQTIWPLFGATIIGVLAFAAIGLSQDSTGEYTRSLFYVVLISLLLSWWFAITVAPLLCDQLLKVTTAGSDKNPYGNLFYKMYEGLLAGSIRLRLFTMMLMVGLLALAIYGFGYVKQSFFPDSTTPMFMVDYWTPQGTDIRQSASDMLALEQAIRKMDGVVDVTSLVGQAAQRFMLVYSPEKPDSSYNQLMIRVKDYRLITALGQKVQKYIASHFPNSETVVKKIRLGPGSDAKIEARFSGTDANVLRKLANEAKLIMHQNPEAIDIRDNWRNRVKVITPVFSESQARQTGVSRKELSDAMQTAFTGMEVGLYREGTELIPIVSRPPDEERLNVKNIDDLHIWSPLLNQTVPIGQIVSHFLTTWEDGVIHRRNRLLTITAKANPASGTASAVFNQLRPKIEAIKLPDGYKLEWGGEHENSSDAQKALATKLPLSFLGMFLILVLLFKSMRQPLIIWLCVPLSFVGVTLGLLATNMAFGFMALLGFLSLTGMLIKNAIVLVDQINLEISEGKDPYKAILDSSISRVRPVALAAVTTVLGMVPLLFDAFFASMAVVIMFGLTFATVLTLVVVPVLYAIFFKIKYQKNCVSIARE